MDNNDLHLIFKVIVIAALTWTVLEVIKILMRRDE